jgi:hypothetical protein
MDLMASWLHSHSYQTLYRPVPIHEHLVYEGKVYPAESTGNFIKTATQLRSQDASSQIQADPVKLIEPSDHKVFRDTVLNSVVSLAYETASTGYGVLVFSGSRGICESDARWISRTMPPPNDIAPLLLEKRMDLLNDLRSLSTGLDPVLEQTILFGVGFHRKFNGTPARSFSVLLIQDQM